ncbi:hypothetical protein GCM10025857_39170 [Alicyclobacillus contaminans]|nr:hypothetical protein GCM10025857_39170 [Alicyclobacillus contaminans]
MGKQLSLFGDEFEQPQLNPDRRKDHREDNGIRPGARCVSAMWRRIVSAAN